MAETKPIAITAPWRQASALLASGKEMGVPLAVLGIVIALITPVPGFLLDGLIVIDIMTSVIVLMVAVHIRKPVDFSIFPPRFSC